MSSSSNRPRCLSAAAWFLGILEAIAGGERDPKALAGLAAADRDRKIRAHLRQLRALRLDVTITPTAA
jgi:hypothetical protein